MNQIYFIWSFPTVRMGWQLSVHAMHSKYPCKNLGKCCYLQLSKPYQDIVIIIKIKKELLALGEHLGCFHGWEAHEGCPVRWLWRWSCCSEGTHWPPTSLWCVIYIILVIVLDSVLCFWKWVSSILEWKYLYCWWCVWFSFVCMMI